MEGIKRKGGGNYYSVVWERKSRQQAAVRSQRLSLCIYIYFLTTDSYVRRLLAMPLVTVANLDMCLPVIAPPFCHSKSCTSSFIC